MFGVFASNRVEWQKNGVPLSTSFRVKTTVDTRNELFTLTINRIKPDDFATYKIMITTKHGVIESSAQLVLEGRFAFWVIFEVKNFLLLYILDEALLEISPFKCLSVKFLISPR